MGTYLFPSSGVHGGDPSSGNATRDACTVVADAGAGTFTLDLDGIADDAAVGHPSTESDTSCGDPADAEARVHAATDAAMRADHAQASNAALLNGQSCTEQEAVHVSDAEAAAASRPETIAAEVRAYYESRNDWPHSISMLSLWKTRRDGHFNSFRLRELQRFTLASCGGSGLTLEDQARLYRLLDIWDGTMPGMPIDEGREQGLRDAFTTCNSFKMAVRNDIDNAVTDAGW